MSIIKKTVNFLTSKKFLINVIGIILFWVVLVWAVLHYFKNFSHFEEELVVPSLLENNINDVPLLLSNSSLRYEVIDSVYNPNLVEGTIIFQDPMPTDSTGLFVKSDRLIKLRVSKRTRLVEVPILTSKSRRFAEAALASRGLRSKITFVPSREDQGSVIQQLHKGEPVTPGLKLPINTQIELVIGEKSSNEMTLIPDLVGLTINEAELRLSATNMLRLFAVCGDCQNLQDSLSARIANQSPEAIDSAQISAGSTITVFARARDLD